MRAFSRRFAPFPFGPRVVPLPGGHHHLGLASRYAALAGPFLLHLYTARAGRIRHTFVLTHSIVGPYLLRVEAHKGSGGVAVRLVMSERADTTDWADGLTPQPPHRRPQSGELQREQRRGAFEPPDRAVHPRRSPVSVLGFIDPSAPPLHRSSLPCPCRRAV